MSLDSLEGGSSYQIDEPDDLELTEIDSALLRDLLEEEDEDEDEEKPSLEVLKNENMTATYEQDLYFSLEDNTSMEENSFFDMMEMMNPALPSNEAMAYMYIDEMVGLGFVGESSELFSTGVSADSNSTSYCCLWQD